MSDTSSLLVYVTAFALGFVIGRITSGQSKQIILNVPDIVPSSGHRVVEHKTSEILKKKNVTIDDTRFVTSVSSNLLANTGKDLGTKIVVEDNVGDSVSKLAQLKKNK